MQKFEIKYRLRSAECDRLNQMRLRSLFNLFQDMADLHAEKFGFGYSFCLQNQMTWVGTGYHLVINRLPKRDEEFVIETWHARSHLMTARRDFELKDLEGNVLVAAYSNWALIDLTKKRPVIVQKYLSDETLVLKKSIDAEFKKVILPQDMGEAVLLQVRKDDIDINLKALIHITEKYGIQNDIHSILNIGSASGHTGSEFPEYCASKGGVIAYTKNVALRVAQYGATCNSLDPGGVLTPLNDCVVNDKKMWDEIMQQTPLKRWATPKEIAQWAYFLTVTNKFCTGQSIIVDGGESINSPFVWPNI